MKLIPMALTVPIYMTLREAVQFTRYPPEAVRQAIEHSLYHVVLFDGEKPIGMARVLGDGCIAFFIKDVIVLPEYRHQGLGSRLITHLQDYIRMKGCENAVVGLMSTPGLEPFYEKHGFICRPAQGLGSGMHWVIDCGE